MNEEPKGITGIALFRLNLFREHDYSKVPVETIGQLRKSGAVYKVIMYHFTLSNDIDFSELYRLRKRLLKRKAGKEKSHSSTDHFIEKRDFLSLLGIKRSILGPPKIYYYGRSEISEPLLSENKMMIKQFWNSYCDYYLPGQREESSATVQRVIDLLNRGQIESREIIKIQNSLNLYTFGDLSVRISEEQVVELSHYLEQFKEAFLVKRCNSFNIYPLIERINQICSLIGRSIHFPDKFSKKIILYYTSGSEKKIVISTGKGSQEVITQAGNDFSKFSKLELEEIRRYVSSINNVTGYYYPLLNEITRELASRSTM